MRALFITNSEDLYCDREGGVQICSQEFLGVVRAAAEATSECHIPRSRRFIDKVRRRLHLGSYLGYCPSQVEASLERTIEIHRPTHIFINKSELMRVAPICRRLAPGIPVVLMSHGNQSGDDLYDVAAPGGRRAGPLSRIPWQWQLGCDLVNESRFRHKFIDMVCVMSEEEETLERWLGAKRTFVIPRVVVPAILHWKPVMNRAGYVGSLGHPPNQVALTSVCEALARRGKRIELRLAGGPSATGESFATRYDFVTYLGPLSETDLKAEASTWSLFLNPIFWLSRGASMKLSKSLGWGIPTLTTRNGRRGYVCNESEMFCTSVDTAQDFVDKMVTLLQSPTDLHRVRDSILAYHTIRPRAAEIGAQLRTFLSDQSFSTS
jgi:hypothetical protein